MKLQKEVISNQKNNKTAQAVEKGAASKKNQGEKNQGEKIQGSGQEMAVMVG